MNGTDVAREREAKGLTQELLATMAGVSVRSIRRAEGGQGVSAETLRCLAAALDVPFEPVAVQEEDVVERTRRRLSEPSKSLPWGICVAQSGFALAFPLTIACLVAYPDLYESLRNIHPSVLAGFLFFQSFGFPVLLGIAAFGDAVAGRRVPTVAAVKRITIVANLVGLTAIGAELAYFAWASPDPVSWSDTLGWLYGPIGPLAFMLMIFVAYRSTTAGELRYVAWKERFLYGEAGRV